MLHACTVTTVATDGNEVHPLLVTATVYEPDEVTFMLCVVAPPGVHVLPVADDEVSVTLPPVQKVVGPPAVIVGVDGIGFTVTTLAIDGDDVHPLLVTFTVYEPDEVTFILCVVAPPGVHVLPVADDEVSVTLPPVQKVVAPELLIVGVAGIGFTVTAIELEVFPLLVQL